MSEGFHKSQVGGSIPLAGSRFFSGLLEFSSTPKNVLESWLRMLRIGSRQVARVGPYLFA